MIIQSEHGYYIVNSDGSREGPYAISAEPASLDLDIQELYQEYGNPVG